MTVSQDQTMEPTFEPEVGGRFDEDDDLLGGMTRALGAFDRRIRRIETRVEPADAGVLDDLKRHRTLIGDEIATVVAARKSAVA